jgi:hypothetical protein
MKLTMIQFLTTPIFYLTPYIFLWSILNGIIVFVLIRVLKLSGSRSTRVATGLTTAIASILWNWSIEFNQSTIHLNVDHPIFRISWADAINGISVFALTSFVLGMFVSKNQEAEQVANIASLAALVTVITDTFCF